MVRASDRRLVIITDPHIKVDPNFFVYRDGLTYESVKEENGFS